MPVPTEFRCVWGEDPWSGKLYGALDALWDGMGLDSGGYKANIPGLLNATGLSINGVPVGSSTDTYLEPSPGGGAVQYGGSLNIGTLVTGQDVLFGVQVRRDLTGGIEGRYDFGAQSEIGSAWISDGGTGGYSCFNAGTNLAGALDYNHFNGYQAFPGFTGSGTLHILTGFFSSPYAHGAGTVDLLYNFHAVNPAGTMPVLEHVGFLCDNINRGSLANWAFKSEGSTPSYLGGDLTLGTGILRTTGVQLLKTATAGDLYYGATGYGCFTAGAAAGYPGVILGYDSSTKAGIISNYGVVSAPQQGVEIWVWDNAGTYNKVVKFHANRSVGFGTDDIEAWGSAFGALEFYESAILYGRATSFLALLSNCYYDSGWKFKSTGTACMYNLSGGIHEFNVAASGSADAAITWTSALTVENDGDVLMVGNCSALSFTDRTPHFKGDAIAAIMKIKGKDGEIDHDSLPAFVRRTIRYRDKNGEPIEEPGRDLGATMSLLIGGVQQQQALIDALRASLN